MRIASEAFMNEDTIPRQYTCDGADVSPPLRFSGVPDEAQSLALICEDPDAPRGIWTHWVLINLDPTTEGLPEGVASNAPALQGAVQGRNDFGNNNYGGPCPPPGPPHRYYFKLYALDTTLNLDTPLTRDRVLEAMQGHILAEAALMGRYQRG